MIPSKKFIYPAACIVATIAGLSVVSQATATAIAPGLETAAETKERLRLLVSRDAQRVDVYRGTKLITSSPVSTGKSGYQTPIGVYSILGKRKWHRSNIYSRAPMPYMQRITWSGIALHAGRVPGYPASHGCIRLPKKFAAELFTMTSVGTDVILTSTPSQPVDISHPALFHPAQPGLALGTHGGGTAPTQPAPAVASIADIEYIVDRMQAFKSRSTSPLRILVTRRTGRQRMMDIQRMLRELGHDPGDIDGYLGPNTGRAIQSFQRSKDEPATGMVTDELVAALHASTGRKPEQGHIYVRQNYKDIFDAPVRLRDPENPLGTHVFAAGHFGDGATKASWTAISVNGTELGTPATALGRIEIPKYVRGRISELLMPGSTLVISDAGLGQETGKGTDFIVQP